METLTPAAANDIQSAWMKLENDAPEQEKRAVFDAMKKLPRSYLAVSPSGMAQVMIDGSPSHARPEPLADAISRAKAAGIQTALRWDTRGHWSE